MASTSHGLALVLVACLVVASTGTVAVTAGPAGEEEPNDSPRTATTLVRDVPVRGAVDHQEDLDGFFFLADAGETVTATVDRRGGNGTLFVVLLDGEFAVVSTITPVRPGETETLGLAVAERGAHYVVVTSSADAGTGDYELVVSGGAHGDGPSRNATRSP